MTTRRFARHLVACAAIALGATSDATAQEAATPVTFNQHVAPVLHRACAQCHHPGGAGPFSLVTFADAAKRAKQLATVTSSGFMPPWKADGHPDEFVAQPRLSPDEVALFRRWAEAPA